MRKTIISGSYHYYKILHEFTYLSVLGTRACTYKLANYFVIGGVLFIFAILPLVVVTLWEGSPTKIRQLLACDSPYHAVLNP